MTIVMKHLIILYRRFIQLKGTEKLVELKMVGPFLTEFQSLSPKSFLHRKHFYTRELLVTVGNKTATHDDQTVTDFAVFGKK